MIGEDCLEAFLDAVKDAAGKIIYVGSQVQKNLRDLGHITLRFNGNKEGENLEGSLYLEDKEIGDIAPGEEIAIYKR